LKRILQDYLFLGAISGSIIMLDQVTKLLVRTYLPINGIWAPWDWLLPYARLFHTQNTGVAFGMFQGANLLFAILAVIVSIAIIIYFPRIPKTDWTLRVALCLQLAGAVGNLLDRIFVGQVTDFISVGNFAVFNIADSSITLGVIVMLVGVWLQERKAKNKQAEPPIATEDPQNPEMSNSIEKLRIDETNHE
jgi:signal peptidase II